MIDTAIAELRPRLEFREQPSTYACTCKKNEDEDSLMLPSKKGRRKRKEHAKAGKLVIELTTVSNNLPM